MQAGGFRLRPKARAWNTGAKLEDGMTQRSSRKITLFAGIVLAIPILFLYNTQTGRELTLGGWRPWVLAIFWTALGALAIRQAIQGRRRARLRRTRMNLLRRFARGRYMFSTEGASEKQASRDLLAQMSAAFSGAPVVLQALQRLEEALTEPAGRQPLIEQHSKVLLDRLCRELNVDSTTVLELG
jgi:hypothetical protein